MFPGSVGFQTPAGRNINVRWSCLIFPFLCRYGHEGNIHLLGSWPHRNYLYSRRNSNNDVRTSGGLFVVPGHFQGISSNLSGPLRLKSIFSGESSENKHQQQFVFYSLASFPASPSLLIILSPPFCSKHTLIRKQTCTILRLLRLPSVPPALMSLSAERW